MISNALIMAGLPIDYQSISNNVTALFVEQDSIYKRLGVDSCDIERNALTYSGVNPVVAHPPCQLWGKMAKINFIRWGGDHNKPGNDNGCFKFALSAVNKFGGVLEHPAETYAWHKFGIKKPINIGWERSGEGWVCEVWQSAYGHRARKRTWLYYRGINTPIDPILDRYYGTHQIGFYDQRGKNKNKPTLSKKEANSTPETFALYLLCLAERSGGAE